MQTKPHPDTRTPSRAGREGVEIENGNRYRLTASFRPLPAEKRGRLAALILTGVPVRGSRPSRAARLTTLKLPNPMILTSPPFFKVEVMASKVASTAVAAAVFVICALSATAAMSSFLVIGPILSLYRINGSLAVMSADVGRKPCKRNDSFFENAGKPCKSPTMMWIKSRWHLHSRNADGAAPKSAAAMRNRRRNQPPSEDQAN